MSESLRRLEARFRRDERCRAMLLWGSLGTGTADAFSDVDVAIVVRNEDYEDVRAGLQAVCQEECGPLAVWLPEADADGFCSIAFLYYAGEELLLYDFQVIATSELPRRLPAAFRPVFDRDGLLPECSAPSTPTEGTPARLKTLIDTWWVYCYLNGKYFRRGDLYKLLYVQQILLRTHVEVLRRGAGKPPGRWWPRDLRDVAECDQQRLHVYFPPPDLPAITRAIAGEVELFAAHARTACERLTLEYPAALDTAVRAHLRHCGVIRD